MSDILQISGLSKFYANGFHALKNINLNVHEAEILALLGPNGAGKSTLFALIQHEIDADAGRLDFPTGWRIASVRQEIADSADAAREFVIDGDTHLRHLQTQRALLWSAPPASQPFDRLRIPSASVAPAAFR